MTLPLVAGLVAGTWISFASHVELPDPDDTRGPLDLRVVRMGSEDAPRWSLYTYDRWRTVEIWDRGYISIKFDTFGDAHFDYYALLRSEGSRLRATLHRDYTRRPDEELRRLDVGRPTRDAVRVRVPFQAMRFAQPDAFRWAVSTSWASGRCLQATCLDRAPDKGAVEEPVAVVPTPTPSDNDR